MLKIRTGAGLLAEPGENTRWGGKICIQVHWLYSCIERKSKKVSVPGLKCREMPRTGMSYHSVCAQYNGPWSQLGVEVLLEYKEFRVPLPSSSLG